MIPSKFSDQTRLLASVNLMRELLDSPSKFKPFQLKVCRSAVDHAADACHFNAGWHMANPNKELKGSAATDKLLADIRMITDYLQTNTKPLRGRGRPSVDVIDPQYVPVLVAITLTGLESDAGGIRALVNSALRDGLLKDRTKIVNGVRTTTTTAAHIKKVNRELAKLAKRREARDRTNNVLIFRPTKKPGRKIPQK